MCRCACRCSPFLLMSIIADMLWLEMGARTRPGRDAEEEPKRPKGGPRRNCTEKTKMVLRKGPPPTKCKTKSHQRFRINGWVPLMVRSEFLESRLGGRASPC